MLQQSLIAAAFVTVSTIGSAQAGDFDGVYNLRTVWSGNFCKTQDINLTVRGHKFSFKDSGNFRWSGYVNNAGLMTLTETPAGNQVPTFGHAPKRLGINYSRWGWIRWNVCGNGRFRLYRKSAE